MATDKTAVVASQTLPSHGASILSAVTIDSYNEELRDREGFIGDRASGRAFWANLADERERISEGDSDPIGEVPSEDISKKKLDKVISEGDAVAAGVVLGTIEESSQEFTAVVHHFMCFWPANVPSKGGAGRHKKPLKFGLQDAVYAARTRLASDKAAELVMIVSCCNGALCDMSDLREIELPGIAPPLVRRLASSMHTYFLGRPFSLCPSSRRLLQSLRLHVLVAASVTLTT